MYCIFCGTENPEVSSFCKKCGKPIEGNEKQLSRKSEATEASEATDRSGFLFPQSVPGGEPPEPSNASFDPDTHEAELKKDAPFLTKYRFLGVLVWFIVILTYNGWSHRPQNADRSGLYIFAAAIGNLTTAAELLLSAAIVYGILSIGKLPSRDREVRTLRKRMFSHPAFQTICILTGVVSAPFIIFLVISLFQTGSTK